MVTDFKKKKKRGIGDSLFFHIAGILILVGFFGLIVANVKMYQKRREYVAQVSSLQNQAKSLEDSNAQLKQGISSSGNDQYIEKVAREQLDLQKPGEQEVSFIMPQTASLKTDGQNQNWFYNAWNWIKSFGK